METGEGAEGPRVEGVQGAAMEEGHCQKVKDYNGRQKDRARSGYEIL